MGRDIRASAIVVAAGNSTRMEGIDKKFSVLAGKTVLERSVLALCRCDFIEEIIVVTRAGDIRRVEALLAGLPKPVRVIPGGETRQASVQQGIQRAYKDCGYYVIHDGARPLVDPGEIERCMLEAVEYGAAALCAPLTDTIKERDGEGFILRTHDRSRLFACHTPQIFEAGRYRQAIQWARQKGLDFTDDCQLFESAGFPVHLTVSKKTNLKITTPEDLAVAGALVGGEERMRIGHGYDVHRLVEGRRLILGGVEIPYEQGLLGHSDADVLLHAVMDSILGAMALGDIGVHFPDRDEAYRGADSMVLLERVHQMMLEQGYALGNLDVTVVAQAPKLQPYVHRMRENISQVLMVPVDRVSVKATTEERLGFTGRGEGISATAVCLLHQKA